MPKIKIKNIPIATYKRICDNEYFCEDCPFHCTVDSSVICVPNFHPNSEEIIELSEKDFPTNREWLESLSNEDLAAFNTHGVLIERYSPYPINIHQIIGSFMASEQGVKEWLSQPCRFLMEEK